MTGDPIERAKHFFRDEGRQEDYPTRLGRYEIVREIGRGGMSVVYEARDPELGRSVALKVPGEGHLGRLQGEATAAARLRHPNIVVIHEIGPSFIAMECLSGQTLAAALPAMSRIVRLRTLETIARAMGYAHGHGVVHRDLKPENIMIEPDGRVVITDFGLARTGGGMDPARSGAPLGTTHYMAPEQVRGDVQAIGPAVDVWALGVILFEMLAGKRPFDAPSAAEVYEQIAHQAVPALPGPLGAIAARALEKDAGRRYPDARAMAADIGHHLGRMNRRPVLYGAAVAVVAAGVAAGAVMLVGSGQRRKVVETLREQARVSLRAALELRRAGAVARTRQFLPPLESAYRQALERSPDLAEGEYLMGRMHRVLMDAGQALAFQERALAKDPRFAPALYERALLLSLARGRAFGDGGEIDPRAARAWETFLSVADRVPAAYRDQVSEASVLLARGLLLHLRGDQGAREIVERALTVDPSLEEGWEALALMVRAGLHAPAREQERRWREAEALYTERIARDRGYLPHLLGRGDLRRGRGERHRELGLDPTRDFQQAEEDLTRAIEIDPRAASAWASRGVIRTSLATTASERGGDPRAALASAEADLSKAIALDPGHAGAWEWRGRLYLARGMFLADHGQNPDADLLAAERDLTEALRLAPQSLATFRWRGRARTQRGMALAKAGNDPTRIFDRAGEDFAYLADHLKSDSRVWVGWSEVAVEQGAFRLRRNEDPLPDFAMAEERIDRAIALEPGFAGAWRQRGFVHLRMADVLEKAGRPAGARQRALAAAADLLRAISINPRLDGELREPMNQARRRATP